jgi:hypothetical protein
MRRDQSRAGGIAWKVRHCSAGYVSSRVRIGDCARTGRASKTAKRRGGGERLEQRQERDHASRPLAHQGPAAPHAHASDMIDTARRDAKRTCRSQINSSPCVSYLMEENTATMRTLVAAHAAANSLDSTTSAGSVQKLSTSILQGTGVSSCATQRMFARGGERQSRAPAPR